MPITYSADDRPSAEEVAALLGAAHFNRPLDDPARVELMLRNADILIAARDGGALVGVVRGLADYASYALVTELCVDAAYKRMGIGRELLRRFRELAGEECAVILHSSEEGHEFYRRLGWDNLVRAWRLPRSR